MNATHSDTDPNAIREQILNAAFELLLRFGYSKTTMGDIARAASMSTANLYRYFENKQDIVDECTARCIDDRLQKVRSVIKSENLSAAEKLKRYALELVDDSHALAGAESLVGELVDAVTRDGSDLLHSKLEMHYELLEQILRAGNESGEFDVDDPEIYARYIFSAFAMFDVPIFIGVYDREEFDKRAAGVVDLLVNGLKPKS